MQPTRPITYRPLTRCAETATRRHLKPQTRRFLTTEINVHHHSTHPSISPFRPSVYKDRAFLGPLGRPWPPSIDIVPWSMAPRRLFTPTCHCSRTLASASHLTVTDLLKPLVYATSMFKASIPIVRTSKARLLDIFGTPRAIQQTSRTASRPSSVTGTPTSFCRSFFGL